MFTYGGVPRRCHRSRRQPARDPRLLIGMWIYAYLEGTPPAREIARQCDYHPAYQWLTAATTCACPEGKTLRYKTRQVLVGQTKYTYAAEAGDCAACPQKARCCPTTTQGRLLVRAEDGPEVAASCSRAEG
jgi:hypothetical protein